MPCDVFRILVKAFWWDSPMISSLVRGLNDETLDDAVVPPTEREQTHRFYRPLQLRQPASLLVIHILAPKFEVDS